MPANTNYPSGSPLRREFDGTLGANLVQALVQCGPLWREPRSAVYTALTGPNLSFSVSFGPGELYRLGRLYRQSRAGEYVDGFSMDFRFQSIPRRLEIDHTTLLALFDRVDLAMSGTTLDVAGHFVLTYLEETARSGDLGWAFGDTVSAGSYES